MDKPSITPLDKAPGARSRYDDFVVTHINQTLTIHGTGNFLVWHRNFIWTFEQTLRNECGYNVGLSTETQGIYMLRTALICHNTGVPSILELGQVVPRPYQFAVYGRQQLLARRQRELLKAQRYQRLELRREPHAPSRRRRLRPDGPIRRVSCQHFSFFSNTTTSR